MQHAMYNSFYALEISYTIIETVQCLQKVFTPTDYFLSQIKKYLHGIFFLPPIK